MFAVWILIGFLINPSFSSEATEFEDEVTETPGKVEILSRPPRHWRNMFLMVSAVTNRSAKEFSSYGNYCGYGNRGGEPVDKIDACCEIHDACYNLTLREACKDYKDKLIPYTLRYRFGWDEAMHIECEESDDQCKNILCQCDSDLATCFKENLESYNSKESKDMSMKELLSLYAIVKADKERNPDDFY